jgi:acyl-CoA reductase-like NAD-dependent aldehyde dehydrogenase
VSYSRTKIFVGGEWVEPFGRTRISVESPTSEEPIGEVPACDEQDVARAVDAASAALPGWRETAPALRADFLARLRDELESRSEEMVTTIIDEVGSPWRIATKIQTELPLTVLDSYVQLLDTFEFESRVGNSLVVAQPIGVVAAITPWNYPLHQLVVKVAAALAAGCTVVAKPSELTPFSTYLLFDAIEAAGLPAGVINLVTGEGPSVGEYLVSHPGVNMVSLTGSTRAGKRVAQLASASLKRISLELGGKSASVILDDADLSTAIKVSLANAYLNSGQTCTAWTRILVDANRYEEALGICRELAGGYALGDPHEKETRLGPLISSPQRTKVRDLISQGLEEGARLVVGGSDAPQGFDRGYFVAPTVLADVHPDDTVAQEEIFGPVACVMSYTDEARALDIANNSIYGLAGAVWSADEGRAEMFARQMHTGSIDINGGRYNPLAPFGGVKQSGIGREMGEYGLEEFLQPTSLQF